MPKPYPDNLPEPPDWAKPEPLRNITPEPPAPEPPVSQYKMPTEDELQKSFDTYNLELYPGYLQSLGQYTAPTTGTVSETATYWNDPARIARYYLAAKSMPPDATLPPWLTAYMPALEAMFNYYQAKNPNKAWYEWQPLTAEDPAYGILDDLLAPPIEALPDWERPVYGTWSYKLDAMGYVAMPKTEAAANLPADVYQQLSEEQKGSEKFIYVPPDVYQEYTANQPQYQVTEQTPLAKRIMYGYLNSPVLTGLVQGAGSGALMGLVFGRLPGAVGGALVGAAIGGFGALGMQSDVDWIRNTATGAMKWLDMPASAVERTFGMIAQVADGDAKEVFENVPAAWRAGQMFYEANLGIRAKPEGGYMSMVTGKEKPTTFVGWRPSTDPNSDELFETIELGAEDVGVQMLNQARDRLIAEPDKYDEIIAELTDKLGMGGVTADTLAHMFLDPWNFVGLPAEGAIKKVKTAQVKRWTAAKQAEEALGEAADAAKIADLDLRIQAADALTQSFSASRQLDMGRMADAIRAYAETLKVRIADPAQIAKLGSFERMITGVIDTNTGSWRVLDGGKKAPINWDWKDLQKPETLSRKAAIAKAIPHIFARTPATQANMVVLNSNDAILTAVMGLNPEEAIKVGHAIYQADPAMMESMPFLKGVGGRAIQMAWAQLGGDLDDIYQTAWVAGENNRKLLSAVGMALGETDPENYAYKGMGAFHDKNGRLIADPSVPLRQAADNLRTRIAAGETNLTPLLNAIEAADGEVIKKIVADYGQGNFALSKTEFGAMVAARMATTVEKWAVSYYGVKPDAIVYRLAQTIKSAQSLVLLGLNPFYPINNWVTNTVTMAYTRTLGINRPNQIKNYWRDFGMTPSRFEEGFGMADVESGVSDAMKTEGVGSLIRQTQMDKPVGESGMMAGVRHSLDSADKKIRQFRRMGIFEQASMRIERNSRQQAMTVATDQMWRAMHKAGKGFDKVEKGNPALFKQMKDLGLDPHALIEMAVEGGMNADQITRLVEGQYSYNIARAMEEMAAADPDAVQIMRDMGIDRRIEARIHDAKTPADVAEAVQSVFREVTREIEEKQLGKLTDDTEKMMGEIITEGPASALQAINGMKLAWYEQHHKSMDDIMSMYEFTQKLDSAERRIQRRIFFAENKRQWQTAWEQRDARTIGILKALRGGGEADERAIPHLMTMHQLWEDYYTTRETLWTQFFNAGDDPRSNKIMWLRESLERILGADEVKRLVDDQLDTNSAYANAIYKAMDKKYDDARLIEMDAQSHIDEIYMELFTERYPQAAPFIKEWIRVSAVFREQQIGAQKYFRTGDSSILDGVEGGDAIKAQVDGILPRSKKLNSLPAAEKNAAWVKFDEKIYKPLTFDEANETHKRMVAAWQAAVNGNPELQVPVMRTGRQAAQPTPAQAPEPAAAPRQPTQVVPEPAAEAPATVKMMITRADEAALRKLGYSQADIDKMRPQEAADIIAAKTPKPSGNKATILALAHEFGIPTATKAGNPNDRYLLNIINKYAFNHDIEQIAKLDDADPAIVRAALEEHKAAEQVRQAADIEQADRLTADTENRHEQLQDMYEGVADIRLAAKTDLEDVMGLTPEQADAVVLLMDGLADYWGAKTGRPAVEWWKTHVAGIVKGGEGLLEQTVSLDTPEWKAFLDGNHAGLVSEDGRPVRMYHGTGQVPFEAFDKSKAGVGLYGKGFYFTDNPEIAGGKVTPSGQVDGGYAQTERAIFSGTVKGKVKQDIIDILSPYFVSGDKKQLLDDFIRTGDLSYIGKADYALGYAIMLDNAKLLGSGQVLPVYLSIKNPIDMDMQLTPAVGKKLADAIEQGDYQFLPFRDGRLPKSETRRYLTAEIHFNNQTQKSTLTVSEALQTIGVPKEYYQDIFKAAGFDGITHLGGGIWGDVRHRVYIAFEPEQVKSIFNPAPTADPRMLHQGPKAAVSWLPNGKAIIHALEAPDISSAIHEGLGHVWLRSLTADAVFKPDMDVITNWLRETYKMDLPDDWASGDIATYRQAHEKFARAAERYCRDGVAPKNASDALKLAFTNFKKWMTHIYRTIKGSDIDVEISPELRAVFDKWLGGERAAGELPPEAPSPHDVLRADYWAENDRRVNPELRAKLDEMTPDELRATIKQLRGEIYRDDLTGLPNIKAWTQAKRKKVAVVLDVRGLKKTNDTYGMGAGDALLREIGQILQRNGIEDEVYHLHGDEFVMQFDTADIAKSVMERVSKDVQDLILDVPEKQKRLTGFDVHYGIGEGTEGTNQAWTSANDALIASKKGADRNAAPVREIEASDVQLVDAPVRADGGDIELRGTERNYIEELEARGTPTTEIERLLYRRRFEVKTMLENGEVVPPEVLADYPDLAAKYNIKPEHVNEGTVIDYGLDDVPYDTALRAFQFSSWEPEKRAIGQQKLYVKHMKEVEAWLIPLADTPEKLEVLRAGLERYKDGYLKHLFAVLGAESTTRSSMVAGPANFPFQANEKRVKTVMARYNELESYSIKAQKQIYMELKPGKRVVRIGDADSVSIFESKILKLEEWQQVMVRANAIIRKNLSREDTVSRLLELGLSDKVIDELLVPNRAGRIEGFPDFQLTGNRRAIKQLRDKVVEATRLQESLRDTQGEWKIDGGYVVENVNNDRIQIFFDAKPDQETIAKLKSRGFHWSPTEGAWQRQLTQNARDVVNELFKRIETDPDKVDIGEPDIDIPVIRPEIDDSLTATVPASAELSPHDVQKPLHLMTRAELTASAQLPENAAFLASLGYKLGDNVKMARGGSLDDWIKAKIVGVVDGKVVLEDETGLQLYTRNADGIKPDETIATSPIPDAAQVGEVPKVEGGVIPVSAEDALKQPEPFIAGVVEVAKKYGLTVEDVKSDVDYEGLVDFDPEAIIPDGYKEDIARLGELQKEGITDPSLRDGFTVEELALNTDVTPAVKGSVAEPVKLPKLSELPEDEAVKAMVRPEGQSWGVYDDTGTLARSFSTPEKAREYARILYRQMVNRANGKDITGGALFQEAPRPRHPAFGAQPGESTRLNGIPLDDGMAETWSRVSGKAPELITRLQDSRMPEGGVAEQYRAKWISEHPDATPEQMQAEMTSFQRNLRSYMAKIDEQMRSEKYAAMKYGEGQADQALLNYRDRRNFDQAVGIFMPYQFWYSRSIINWALRIATNPAYMANYLRAKHWIDEYNEGQNLPTRLKGKIKIPTGGYLPDYMGDGIYVDPLKPIFPFHQFGNVLRNISKDDNMQTKRAIALLEDMAAEDESLNEQVIQAIQSRSGELWQKAWAQAGSEIDRGVDNPIDALGMMAGYSLPLQAMIKAGQGEWDEMGQLPPTRAIQTITGALGIGGPEGITDKPIRRWMGMSENTPFYNYAIDKATAEMVVDGYDIDEVKLALQNRKGPVYDEALRRVAKQNAIKYLLAPLSADFFPEGEEVLREVRTEYDVAVKKMLTGQRADYDKFFDEHPEYEAQRLAWTEPEERVRKYLISQIWDAYLKLPYEQQKDVKKAFGEPFTDAFLNKATRAYDVIDDETLALWARSLGQKTPDAAKGGVMNLNLTDPEVARKIEKFYSDRDRLFPDISRIQTLMYALPVEQQAIYAKQYPQLKEYSKWKTQWMAANPDVAPLMTSEQNEMAGYPAAVQNIVYQYKAERDRLYPGILDKQTEYYDNLTDEQRKAYLAAHPELRQYWDWREKVAAAFPTAAQFILGEEGLSNRILNDYKTEKISEEVLGRMSAPLISQLNGYAAGQSLTQGALEQLKRIWTESGEPGGTFDGWLSLLKQYFRD